MKKCSVLLIREIQIKATKRHNFLPIKLSKVKNFDNKFSGHVFKEKVVTFTKCELVQLILRAI